MTVKTYPWAYIVHVEDPAQRLEFQIFPEEISMSKAAEYTSMGIVGRSEPVRAYSSSGSKTYSFELTFVASVDQNDGGSSYDVLEKINWLESLVYPEYKNNITYPPPVVFLIVGDAINARCITTEVSPVLRGPWEINESPLGDEFNWEGPIQAVASVTFEEVNLTPLSSTDIRNRLLY